MPLVLVTGPANSAKAGVVLERFRAVLPRDPLLVVPTAADAAHYQRELVAGGAAFGGDVVTFSRLVREIAARAGMPGRPLGSVARERVVRAAIRDARLHALAPSAAGPGFPAAVGDLVAELQRNLVPPDRLTAALRVWAAAEAEGCGGAARAGAPPADGGPAARAGAPPVDGGVAARAEELGRLYAAYRARLARLGRHDAEGFAWAALDALRARPLSWAHRPVFLYGFDDLTRTELDAVETLAGPAGAEVWVALPHEPGRLALAGTARVVADLAALEHRAKPLEDRADHYAEEARGALHHLERRLFETDPPRVAPNGAVRLLEAGGERAEAELVGAEVLELLRDGMAPGEIAILARGDRGLLAQVLGLYGVPVAEASRVPLHATRLGTGVLGLARAATGAGTAADLLAWLRTPGRLPSPDPVDALEARLRRHEIEDLAGARRVWAELHGRVSAELHGRVGAELHGRVWAELHAGAEGRPGEAPPLEVLDAVAAAAEAGPVALLEALEREAQAIWTAPLRRRAAVIGPGALADARAAAALRAAAAELRALADADPELLAGPRDVVEALAAVRVPAPEGEPDGVVLADPLAIRGRRFRAVFLCGLQAGELPRAPVPDPFLSDDERRAVARASGLVLPLHEDVLARERLLFYEAASRPEEVLFLSWRSSTEEGDPLEPSPFLDDVRALYTEELDTRRGRRLLAEISWPPRDAPTPHELRRARAAEAGAAAAGRAGDAASAPLAPPRTRAVLDLLAARRREPARGLEGFAACGVRWLVEELLRPGRVEPDPEPMRRGSLAHAVLERTLRGLRERTGSARLAPERLALAEAELDRALAELARTPAGLGARAGLRALETSLRRVLRHEAEHGAGLEPAWLEWRFGGEGDAHGPLELADGTEVTGRVDRIDVHASGRAIVRDYKLSKGASRARWAEEGHLQVALYLLAARELLGLDPVAGVYQPVTSSEQRPRGLVREGTPGEWFANDEADPGGFADALHAALERARTAAADLRAGRLRPCPERCTPKGCAHPTICRAG